MPSAGQILLALCIFCDIGVVLFRKSLSRGFFFAGAAALFFSLCLLAYAFVSSDFSMEQVFLYSGSKLPLLYKIGAIWSGHEGSFLLWTAALSSALAAEFYFRGEIFGGSEIVISSCTRLLFVSYIYLFSDPFGSTGMSLKEGLGLNPVLQDEALAIHPPLLYLGNILFAVPFVYSVSALVEKKKEESSFKISFRYTAMAMAFLSAGIGLGARWAYRELGWGGYWFFDPVENISLLPWLCGIISLHFLSVRIKSGKFSALCLIFSVITFLSVVAGTFFARSGLLSSVHSFAYSEEKSFYLFAVSFFIITLSSLILIFRVRYFFGETKKNYSVSEKTIAAGSIFWLAAFLSLLASVLYPLASLFFRGEYISLEIPYFTFSFIPCLIGALWLCAFFGEKFKYLPILISLSLASAAGILFKILSGDGFLLAFSFTSGSFLALNSLRARLEKKYSKKSIGKFLGHFGAGLLALSVSLNLGFKREYEFYGEKGSNASFDNFTIELKDVSFGKEGGYYSQIAEFWVEDSDRNKITILRPENRFYRNERKLSQESSIVSSIGGDVYAVLGKIEGEKIGCFFYEEPAVPFIWISVALICAGFLYPALRKSAAY